MPQANTNNRIQYYDPTGIRRLPTAVPIGRRRDRGRRSDRTSHSASHCGRAHEFTAIVNLIDDGEIAPVEQRRIRPELRVHLSA